MKSRMRFIKSALEYRSIDELSKVPRRLRGIYALYLKNGHSYNVVYIGMSGKEVSGHIKNRLSKHNHSTKKKWTHFSYYEVWDNVSDLEIKEIEGLFRQLYRFDSRANFYNKQLTHKPLVKLRRETEKELSLKTMRSKK